MTSEEFFQELEERFGGGLSRPSGPLVCERCADRDRRPVRHAFQPGIREGIETVYAGLGVLLDWLQALNGPRRNDE
jgi:hypothetical protein